MSYIYNLTLDLNTNIPYAVVPAKQGDDGGRLINIKITNNGQDYNIPQEGYTVYCRLRKPDGKGVVNGAYIQTDGTIMVELTSQMLAVAGRAYADIVICSASDSSSDSMQMDVLSTVSFILNIMSAPDITGNVTSSDEFTKLTDLINEAYGEIRLAREWAIGSSLAMHTFTFSGNWAIGDVLTVSQGATSLIDNITVEEASASGAGEAVYAALQSTSAITDNYVVEYGIINDGTIDNRDEPLTYNEIEDTVYNAPSDSISNIPIGTFTITTEEDHTVIKLTERTAGHEAVTCMKKSGSGSGTVTNRTTITTSPSDTNNSMYYAESVGNTVNALDSWVVNAYTAPSASASVMVNRTSAPYFTSFELGIPAGPTGPMPSIGSVSATSTAYGQNPQVIITPSGDNWDFSFVIPSGMNGTGAVSSVDGQGPNSTGNVVLNAVSYSPQSAFSSEARAVARTNLGLPSYANTSNQYLTSLTSDSYTWSTIQQVPSTGQVTVNKFLMSTGSSYQWESVPVSAIPNNFIENALT